MWCEIIQINVKYQGVLQVKSQIGSAEKDVWESLGEKDLNISVSVNCPFKSQLKIKSIKSNHFLLSHHHSTSALVSEILTSVLQTVQKKQQFTYGQYMFTDCTEDNVQNTHTYTQYTQCTIKTYLVINYTLYTVWAHLH